MRKVYIDFETKCELDIRTTGGAIYSEHPSCDVLCVGYTDVAGDPNVNWLDTGTDLKSFGKQGLLYDLATDPTVIFVAHNAIFEQFIWKNVLVKKYGFSEVPIERWRCTMAKSYAHGLPGKLEEAAEILQLPIQKDMEGRDNMLSLSKPIPKRKYTIANAKMFAKELGLTIPKNKRTAWEWMAGDRLPVYEKTTEQYLNELLALPGVLAAFDEIRFYTPEKQPEKFQKLYEYCKTDVEVCRHIDKRLPDLSDSEQKVWFIDQRMNQAGLFVDRPLVEKVIRLIDTHNQVLLNTFSNLTNGKVESPRQRAKLLEYLNANGINIDNTQKATIAVLEKHEDADVNKALEITKELSRSSVAKYQSMLDRSTETGRVRELVQYHAAHTGRWGGRGIQIQNFPRTNSVIKPDVLSKAVYSELVQSYPNLIDTLATSLRSMIVPATGNVLFIGDLAQMEARVLAWLAGEQKVLDAFRNGEDLYCIAASDIFGYPVTKENKYERQIGKVAVLALGYGGGIGAFYNMAKGYGLDLSGIADKIWTEANDQEQENAAKAYELYSERAADGDRLPEVSAFAADIIKQRWRKANPNIVNFWKTLQESVTYATSKGVKYSIPVGPENHRQIMDWYIDDIYLKCKLPSDKVMGYPYPQFSNKTVSYYSTKGRQTTYGGKLSENITQAVQRDILRDAIIRLSDAGFNLKFHVHDEIVVEEVDDENEYYTWHSFEVFKETMAAVPAWADGMPIDVDAKIAKRYEK